MPKVVIQEPTPEESQIILSDLAAVMERIIAKEFGTKVEVELTWKTETNPKEIIGA